MDVYDIGVDLKDGVRDAAFAMATSRADPAEGAHFSVNSLVKNFQAARYLDFPDPMRQRGEERF